MNDEDRRTLSKFLDSRAEGAYDDAASILEGLVTSLRDPENRDVEEIELSLGQALALVGEARGFLNAAADVMEKEDLPQ